MLHRMALRVLPSLSLAVTEDSVRKQKRIVMFVPGLVAFVVYRLAKLLLPLSEPIVLLMVSGLVALVTALVSLSRRSRHCVGEDPPRGWEPFADVAWRLDRVCVWGPVVSTGLGAALARRV